MRLIKKKWRRLLGAIAIYLAMIGIVRIFSPHYARLVSGSLLNDEATIPVWIGMRIPLATVIVIGVICSFIRTFVSFYCLHMEAGDIAPDNTATLRKPIYRWLARISKKFPDAGLSLAAATPCPVYFLVFLLNTSKSRIPKGYAIFLIQCGNTARVTMLALGAHIIGPELLQSFWHHAVNIFTNLFRFVS